MTSTLFVEELKGRTSGTNANKVIVPSGQKIAGTDTGSVYAPGMIIQTVYNNQCNAQTTSSTSLVDTGLTVNITPKFQNSVFIIHSSQNFYVTEEPGTDAQVQFVIQRVISGGATTQIKEAIVGDHTGSGNRSTTWGENNFTVYDSPNTTSQLTYKTQYKVYNSGWTAGVQTSSQCSHIIVHEVKQ
tara:strand:- start:458 stop:1015 length:558 start_codon:yes stop_codon:yes gene_type:complete